MLSVSPTTISQWHNSADPADVFGTGTVTPLDALAVINYLNANGTTADGAVTSTVSTATASPLLTSGSQLTHPLLDVNADGMISPADALAVIDQLNSPAPQMEYRLQVADDSGTPITSIPVNQDFELEVFVTDLRQNVSPTGVFAAYLNTSYNSTLATLDATPITHAAPYTNGEAGDTSTLGQINDAGGFASLSPTGSSEMLLETMHFTATTAGQLTFTPSLPNPATDSPHDTQLYYNTQDSEAYVDPSQIETNTASVTITSNSAPAISISNVSQGDASTGTTPFVFDVTLSAASATQVTVNYATADGTATAGAGQYVPINPTPLIFPAGQTLEHITVQVPGSTSIQPNETFKVNLSNPVGATILNGTGTGTILAAATGVSVNNVTVPEVSTGTTQAVFTVTLAEPLAQQATIAYATADGTATSPANYSQTPPTGTGTLTFASGVTSLQVTVTVQADPTPEPATNFFLNLSNPSSNLAITSGQGTATIAPVTAPKWSSPWKSWTRLRCSRLSVP